MNNTVQETQPVETVEPTAVPTEVPTEPVTADPVPAEEAADVPDATPVDKVEPTEDKPVAAYDVFSETTWFTLILFLVVYATIYFILGFFNSMETNFQSRFSRAIDALFMLGFLGATIAFYIVVPNNQKTDVLKDYGYQVKDYVESDMAFFYQVGFIIFMYMLFYLFRVPMTVLTKPAVIFTIESLAWVLLIMIVVVQFVNYSFAGVDLLGDFMNWLFPSPPPEAAPAPEPRDMREVFNISNNKFTYDEAQAICKAYGAELATYDQIESAYNDGAEWCNYGWSANQMAFFPTQKKTWDTLQTTENRKNACGRPGVNGGYMANPAIRFGVNCYGIKPEADENDIRGSEPTIPKTEEEKKIDERVKFWMDNKEQHLQVNSHNYKKWSEHE